MKRLRFRHHDTVFPNRGKALEFFNDIVDSTKIVSTEFGESLYAEPMVVKYHDSNNNQHVILAIGVDSPNVKYHIIDSQELYELIKQNEQSIKDETERAIAQEIFLEGRIDAEYERAFSAETALHGRIDDEYKRAFSAETALDEKIVAETERAILAETALQTNIDNNKTKIVQVTQSGENILEEYALKNALGETLGDTIKVYKDSSLVGALTGFKGAKYVEKNEDGTFSLLYDENTRDESVEFLYLVYKNENGELRLVGIDFENFLMEAEFGDGLKVINHVASIKVKDGEKYLTTSKDGISTIGIDDAINESVNELKENVDEKLETLTNTFDEKLDTLSDTLSGNIITLTEEFINVSNALSGNIISLDTKIDAEVKTLDEKIDNVNDSLSANIITVDTKIDTQVGILNKRIDEEVSTLDKKIDDEVSVLDKRIVEQVDILDDRIDTEVKTLNEKIDTSIDTLELNLNEVINTKETELRKEITSNKISSKDVVLIENETGTTLEIQADEITITKKADASTIYDTNVAVFGSLLKVKQVEPTSSSIKTRYELQGADGKLIGDAIELPIESALISVKQGKEGDEIDKSTGNYIKFGEGDTTMNFIYRLADGSFELAQIIISEYFTDAHFGYGLNNQDGVVSLKEGDGNEYLVIGIDTISVIGVNDAIRNATNEVEEKLTEYVDTKISTVNERIDEEVAELKGMISDESTEREEADKELQANIDAEYERAVSAETALHGRIDVESTERKDADKKLQEKIDAEYERAFSAETALDKKVNEALDTINENISEKVDDAISNSLENINDEIEEKINEAISGVLDTNITERVDELQAKIDAEYERAFSAETALQTSINNLSGEIETTARETAAEEIAKIIADSEESLETLKEIAEWISNDTTGAAQMANDIASLKTSDAENVANINSLSGSVSTLNGNVNTLSGSINTISGNVKSLSGNVSTISGNVESLSGSVITLSGSVSTLSGNFETLSGSVSSDISILSGAITTLEGKITGSTGDSGSTNIDENIINELRTQISGLTDEIVELSDEISGLTDEISALNLKISGLTDEINSIRESQKETVRDIIKSYLVGTDKEIKIYEIPEDSKIYDEDKLAIGFADDAIFG